MCKSLSELAPEERRTQIAAILAQGVCRWRQKQQLAQSENLSESAAVGLEVSSQTRLSVTEGLYPATESQHAR
jgi:hypothetical protein